MIPFDLAEPKSLSEAIKLLDPDDATVRPIAGGTALMHNGSNTMWYIVMWLAPEKDFSVIVATNIAGDDAEKGCDEMAVAMIEKWLPGK